MCSIIGQTKTVEIINRWQEAGKVPRFIILEGPKGAGKKLITPLLAQGELVNIGNKVDDIRFMVETCYSAVSLITYCIQEADTMSASAANSLLKITEEPPRKAHFVLHTEVSSNLLTTIRSRGTLLKLQPYTRDEIVAYIKSLKVDVNTELFSMFCRTPGEVNEHLKFNMQKFYDDVSKFVDGLPIVSGVDCFRYTNFMKFKDTDTGYDPIFFMRGVLQYARENALKYEADGEMNGQTIYWTAKFITQMEIKGVNKLSTFDSWILKLREIWRDC